MDFYSLWFPSHSTSTTSTRASSRRAPAPTSTSSTSRGSSPPSWERGRRAPWSVRTATVRRRRAGRCSPPSRWRRDRMGHCTWRIIIWSGGSGLMALSPPCSSSSKQICSFSKSFLLVVTFAVNITSIEWDLCVDFSLFWIFFQLRTSKIWQWLLRQ